MRLLNYVIFLAVFIAYLPGAFSQQTDCTNGRFTDSIFAVTVTQNVQYGQNTNYDGTTRQLKMDIYEPAGDTMLQRPLIIFAPKGSFLQESKTELTMVTLCTRFAQMGYVTAAIDYRVGVNYILAAADPDKEFTLAVMRATHDYRAAIRFFRKDAATANLYKIDPNLIIAGGSSAGAITALHVAYLEHMSEIPAGVIDTTGLGGIEGQSGSAGYASNPQYVVNLCGAIADTIWMVSGDIPVVSMHGNLDTEVPYGTAVITMLVPIMEVDGSASIHERCLHTGIDNPFYTFWGKQHIPYDENAGGSYLLYMDTVINYVKTALSGWVCNPTKINHIEQVTPQVLIYPNPAGNTLVVNSGLENAHLNILSITGEVVFSAELHSIVEALNLQTLAGGMYFAVISNGQQTKVAKLVIK